MLIASLPAVHEEERLGTILAHPLVAAARYNIGAASPYDPVETLRRLQTLAQAAGKSLWIDLKGRQLRVAAWSYPRHGGRIRLNHAVEALPGARVYFRGGEWTELRVVRDDVIWVDPPPRHAVGAGQSVVIVADDLEVRGYLTAEDKAYVAAAVQLGIPRFMLSFVEGPDDLAELLRTISEAGGQPDSTEVVLKIESPKGLAYVTSLESVPAGCALMAARDDLLATHHDDRGRALPALRRIVSTDPNAICASQIFPMVERTGRPSMADISDLALMRHLGYRRFMLSDGLSRERFEAAMALWADLLPA